MEHIHREKATWCLLEEWDLCCTRTHQTDDARKVSSSSQLQQNEAFFTAIAIPFVEKKTWHQKGHAVCWEQTPICNFFHACSKSRFQFTREEKWKKMPKKMTPNKNGGAICCSPTTPNCNLVLALQHQFHLWRRNSKWEITDWTHIFCATNGRILSFDIYMVPETENQINNTNANWW